MCQSLPSKGTRSISRDVSESPVYRYSFYVLWCFRVSSLLVFVLCPVMCQNLQSTVLVICPVMCQSLQSTGTRYMSRDVSKSPVFRNSLYVPWCVRVSSLQVLVLFLWCVRVSSLQVLVLCPVMCQSLQSTGTRSMSRDVSESPVYRISFYVPWCVRVSSLQVLALCPVMCQDLQSTGTRSKSRDVSESPIYRYSFYVPWCFWISSLQVLVLCPVIFQSLQSTSNISMSRDVSGSPV